MVEHDHTHDDNHHEIEGEILIGRILDGETQPGDTDRFEQMANLEPSLWRELALRQRDMAMLVARVDRETLAADRVELPATAMTKMTDSARSKRWTWPIATLGWAAMLVVSLAWWASGVRSPDAQTPTVRSISSQDHFDGYLNADFVFGEMPPVVLDVETLSDGRLAVRFIRRIEEFGFLDPNVELPVDENGELDAAKLRRVEPAVGLRQL